jgi:hypothetical protein
MHKKLNNHGSMQYFLAFFIQVKNTLKAYSKRNSKYFVIIIIKSNILPKIQKNSAIQFIFNTIQFNLDQNLAMVISSIDFCSELLLHHKLSYYLMNPYC